MAEPKEQMETQTDPIVDTRENQSEDALIEELRGNFEAAAAWEEDEREEGISDLQFKKGGDYQWPDDILQERRNPTNKRPVLTINRLPMFTDRIIGDSRQNKIEIKITARNNSEKALECAKRREGLIRNIQEQSDADFAYQTAEQGAIDAGRGVISIEAVDNDENPFIRDLRIVRVPNPYSHYFDPKYYTSGLEKDRRWHIVTELISRDEFDKRYPGKTPMSAQSGTGDAVTWATKEEVRIIDYWVKRPKKKKIYLLSDNRIVDGGDWDKVMDELEESMMEEVPEITKEKEIDSYYIEWYKADGSQILDGPKKYPGLFIPHVPVWGKELIIDGKRDVRGVIRHAKDPSRIYNYERTAEVEQVALAKIPPTDVTPKMIEGHENMWNSDANLKYRLFNADSAVGGAFPKRNDPPKLSASTPLAQQAIQEIHDTTGLQAPAIGRSSGSHVSGIKEKALMSEGDVGTFEYHDNLARAVKKVGKILNNLLPIYYDTEREEMILGEDGSRNYIKLNQRIYDTESREWVTISDLGAGQFDVAVKVGPSHTTQRQETQSNLIDLSKAAPMIGELGADILAKTLDIVEADELVKRIRWRMILAGLIEPDDEEKKQLQVKMAQQQQNAQSDPEVLKALAKAEGQKIDVEKKKVNLGTAILEFQEQLAQMQDNMKNIAENAAAGAIEQVLRTMGVGGQA